MTRLQIWGEKRNYLGSVVLSSLWSSLFSSTGLSSSLPKRVTRYPENLPPDARNATTRPKKMLKKGVPEWMNGSSFWSSLSSSLSPRSKPNSPRSDCPSASSSSGARTGTESETPLSRPALGPSPLQSADAIPSEEISRQSQLLAEVGSPPL